MVAIPLGENKGKEEGSIREEGEFFDATGSGKRTRLGPKE